MSVHVFYCSGWFCICVRPLCSSIQCLVFLFQCLYMSSLPMPGRGVSLFQCLGVVSLFQCPGVVSLFQCPGVVSLFQCLCSNTLVYAGTCPLPQCLGLCPPPLVAQQYLILFIWPHTTHCAPPPPPPPPHTHTHTHTQLQYAAVQVSQTGGRGLHSTHLAANVTALACASLTIPAPYMPMYRLFTYNSQ